MKHVQIYSGLVFFTYYYIQVVCFARVRPVTTGTRRFHKKLEIQKTPARRFLYRSL